MNEWEQKEGEGGRKEGRGAEARAASPALSRRATATNTACGSRQLSREESKRLHKVGAKLVY